MGCGGAEGTFQHLQVVLVRSRVSRLSCAVKQAGFFSKRGEVMRDHVGLYSEELWFPAGRTPRQLTQQGPSPISRTHQRATLLVRASHVRMAAFNVPFDSNAPKYPVALMVEASRETCSPHRTARSYRPGYR